MKKLQVANNTINDNMPALQYALLVKSNPKTAQL